MTPKHSRSLKYILATFSAASLGLIATSAQARPPADINHDGQITRAEFIAAADARFARTDANHDGMITTNERQADKQARRAEHVERKFATMDANGDGFISKDEFINSANKKAEHRDERRQARKIKRKERRIKKRMKKNRPVKVDANGDGVVTRTEHNAATEALFNHLDINGDGILSQGEGRKARHHMPPNPNMPPRP